MTKKNRILINVTAISVFAVILLLLFYNGYMSTRQQDARKIVAKTLSPEPIMSTPQFNIIAVGQNGNIGRSLSLAESAARIVEREMNIYNPASELSRFNSAAPETLVKLSRETRQAIHLAKQSYDDTGGAFDATLRPVILLWKKAAKNNKLPSDAELTAARTSSSWADFDFSDDKITKKKMSACVDLGGIAKGYAIDLATNSLRQTGCTGGLVDIGGDIGCFGKKADGSKWVIGVRDPFAPHSDKMLATLRLTDAAVCTSGNYERASMIQGQRCNHIIDPRTARPADACPSVTVIAPTAAQADAWATALSVLGPAGLKLLLENSTIHAMLVTGDKDDFTIVTSPGFSRFVTQWEYPEK